MTLKLSRQDLLDLCEIFKAKALQEHELFRKWQARALEAEGRLAIYEPGDQESATQQREKTS
jgi:hypothetical protein